MTRRPTRLTKMNSKGVAEVLEDGATIKAHKSYYYGREVISIGKKHHLHLTEEDAIALRDRLNEHYPR